ncbi:hypothetical protein N0V88_004588 [Collariella sp. IMI 366227]|nr:hypothetical protein N0V88_004588 [Collariella sp. IMI 366227]
MAPSDSSAHQRARQSAQRSDTGISADETARSNAPSPQGRNYGQSDTAPSRVEQELMLSNPESWVEVASQPSSSSLSSIGEDIVTTGLRVGSSSYPPRRRRPQQQHPMPASFIIGHPATQGGATSSQEEYDETESEEDRVMTSSTEAIHPAANLQLPTTARVAVVDTDSDTDDDGNATALGRPSNNTPCSGPSPTPSPTPVAPQPPTLNQLTGHTPAPPGPAKLHVPTYQADNDAALRASLTTLLSCAAAARGLPNKHEERRSTGPGAAGAGVLPSSQPMELRLVPESELMAGDAPPSRGTLQTQQPTTTGTGTGKPPPNAQPPHPKPPTNPAQQKKKRTSNHTTPTLISI